MTRPVKIEVTVTFGDSEQVPMSMLFPTGEAEEILTFLVSVSHFISSLEEIENELLYGKSPSEVPKGIFNFTNPKKV